MIIPVKLAVFWAGSAVTATVTIIAQEVVKSPKFSPESIAMWTSSAVIVIGALTTWSVAVVNAVKRQGTETKEAVQKVGLAIAAKQDEVKAEVLETKADGKLTGGHVNSIATAAQGREDGLRKENEMLRAERDQLRQTAALLAQAAAIKAPTVVTVAAPVAPVAVAPPSTSAEASLEQMDQNTSQTAKNTAKTDIAVKEALNK